MISFISIDQYFNNKRQAPEVTSKVEWSAEILLGRVDLLLGEFESTTGFHVAVNPSTKNHISGNHEGDGGFRLGASTTGAAGSSHKEGRGVDIFDPDGALDEWITDAILEKYSLYREDPSATIRWCHLTTRAPGSGKRTFKP